MSGRILFLNRWPQHRTGRDWANSLARPEDLLDHERYDVTYLCDTRGASGVPPGARTVVHVEDFDCVDNVLATVDDIVSRGGSFEHVIAFSEFLLDLAARIREQHGTPGPRPDEVDRFRDKTLMKTILAKACVRVPRWVRCESPEQVVAESRLLGFPLIFKPVRGASSEGVHRVESADQLAEICAAENVADHEIEEFITGEVMHADGVVDQDGDCVFLCISRYISNCLMFESGEPLGSVIQTDPAVRARAEAFARTCLSTLGLRASAFHLEFFDTGAELVFLEIGARVPGADVPYVINDVHGVNLYRLWVDVMLGRPVVRPASDLDESGGWLTIPRPWPLPQRVISATPLLGKAPFLYRELVPSPGDVLTHTGGYATLQAARFLFRGGDQEQIAEAIRTARDRYRLTAVPVATSVPGSE